MLPVHPIKAIKAFVNWRQFVRICLLHFYASGSSSVEHMLDRGKLCLSLKAVTGGWHGAQSAAADSMLGSVVPYQWQRLYLLACHCLSVIASLTPKARLRVTLECLPLNILIATLMCLIWCSRNKWNLSPLLAKFKVKWSVYRLKKNTQMILHRYVLMNVTTLNEQANHQILLIWKSTN